MTILLIFDTGDEFEEIPWLRPLRLMQDHNFVEIAEAQSLNVVALHGVRIRQRTATPLIRKTFAEP